MDTSRRTERRFDHAAYVNKFCFQCTQVYCPQKTAQRYPFDFGKTVLANVTRNKNHCDHVHVSYGAFNALLLFITSPGMEVVDLARYVGRFRQSRRRRGKRPRTF